MTTSCIFCNKSSHARLGLPLLLKIGGSKSFFWLLNLRFQFLKNVRKKVCCGYFYLKGLIAPGTPLLHVYFLTSSLTREGMLLYEEPFLPFFLTDVLQFNIYNRCISNHNISSCFD